MLRYTGGSPFQHLPCFPILKKTQKPLDSFSSACAAGIIHSHPLRKAVLLILHFVFCIFSASSSLLHAISITCAHVSVSPVLKKASPGSLITLQPSPSFPSQTPFSCLHFVFLTSHSLILLICYIEPLEAAGIIDSAPNISPNQLS